MKKPMKTPGAPGAAMTRRSPLSPLPGTVQGTGMGGVDDASAADVFAAGLRPKNTQGRGASPTGIKGYKSRSATNASAQFRITASRNPAATPTYAPTLANGPILPTVMGSRQNFYAAGRYGSMNG